MTHLHQLRGELADYEAEAADLRLKIGAANDREERERFRVRLRLVDQFVIEGKADIETELQRLSGAEAVAKRAKARTERDAVLRDQEKVLTPAWMRLDALLRDTITAAAELTQQANGIAARAVNVARAHHDESHAAAANESGRAVDLILGNGRHATAIAFLLRDLHRALPSRTALLLNQYVEFNDFAMSGLASRDMHTACTATAADLHSRLKSLLVEDHALAAIEAVDRRKAADKKVADDAHAKRRADLEAIGFIGVEGYLIPGAAA